MTEDKYYGFDKNWVSPNKVIGRKELKNPGDKEYYGRPACRTKKEMKKQFKDGEKLRVHHNNSFGPIQSGKVTLTFTRTTTWYEYVDVVIENGFITEVIG